jgi:hypothetical protein
MNAEDRNVSGSSRNCITAISDSSRRISSASPLESAPKPVPSRPASTIRTTTPPTPPPKLAPTTSARPMMISAWIAMLSELCSTRPLISALRRTGETRKRSTTPRSRSSIIDIPPQPAENTAVIMTTLGARNAM